MTGIFCVVKATTDEEYRRHVQRRALLYAGVVLLGIITAVVACLAEFVWEVEVSSRMLGFYTGCGTGLALGGGVILVKSLLLLRDAEKLHRARIDEADERNVEISTMAMKVAILVLLVGMYVVLLIGGLWYPVLIKVLGFLVTLFLFSYIVARKIISCRI